MLPNSSAVIEPLSVSPRKISKYGFACRKLATAIGILFSDVSISIFGRSNLETLKVGPIKDVAEGFAQK